MKLISGRSFCVFDLLLQHPDPAERLSTPGHRAEGPVATSDVGPRRLHVHRRNGHHATGKAETTLFPLSSG